MNLLLRLMLCGVFVSAPLLAAGSTLDELRTLEAGKGAGIPAPLMQEREAGALPMESPQRAVPTPRWYALSDGRQVNLAEWKIVLFMQSSCSFCHQFDPVLRAFSQQSGLSVFPFSLDGKGDTAFPEVMPATPDVMVEFFQNGLPVATPTTFLTNVNTMETYPLLQQAADMPLLTSRLDEVFRLALDRHSTSPGGRP